MAKNFEWKIKNSEGGMDTFYPDTHADIVEGLNEELAELTGGVDFSEVEELIDDAEDLISDVSDVLFFPIPVPAVTNGPFIYNGSVITPAWSNYNNTRLTIGGTTSAKNAGTYTTTFTPRLTAFKWADTEDNSVRSVTWTIAKATNNGTLSANSFAITTNNLSTTVSLDTDSPGVITAVSSNENVATVEVDGTDIIITGVTNAESVTIDIYQAESANYLGGHWTISGTVSFIGTLAQSTPELIQYIAQNDLASSYWAIGDWFPVTLNGTWSCADNSIVFDNYTVRCVLIGINHNAAWEGNHLLHFQMGKNTDNVDIAFAGTKFNVTDTISDGWSGSNMRNVSMYNLYRNILPADLKAVMRECIKYTDNIGDGTNKSGNVTRTSEYCFLLSEVEIYGAATYSNSGELLRQEQYAYYANGNSKVKYNHTNTSATVKNFLRSVNVTGSGGKALAANGNSISKESPLSIYGMSPVFCIGCETHKVNLSVDNGNLYLSLEEENTVSDKYVQMESGDFTLTIDNDTVEVNTVSVSNSDGESVDNNLHCKVL